MSVPNRQIGWGQEEILLQFITKQLDRLIAVTSKISGGGGSGTVNSGTTGQLAYYAANGTTISGTTPGTGVLTALGVNIGSAGAPVINGGALGTPSSGVATNLTGTAAGLTAGNVTTNANLTGPITSVGNATSVTAGAITNSMLGTDVISKNLSEVGAVINENFASLSSWTKVGTQTFTVSSNQLSVIGGSPGSITLTNYYKQTAYGPTMYNYWTITFNITVGTISASSYGVAFGIQSTSASSPLSMQIGIMLDATNAGHIFAFSNNSNTILAQTTKPLPSVIAGNVLSVTIKRINRSLYATITNTSVSPKTQVTLPLDAAEGNCPIPNVGNIAIYAMGGTHTVSPLTYASNHKKNVDVLFIGDSRTQGSGAFNTKNTFTNLIANYFNANVDQYAGSGCINTDYVPSEVLQIAPVNIVFLSGTNDQTAGHSNATIVSDAQTFFTSLTGYTLGSNLWYIDETPKGSADMSSLSDLYKSTLGTTGCLYLYRSLLASSGTGPITNYFLSDVLHPNNYGHNQIATILASQITFLNRKNYANPYNSIAYFRNGKMQIANDLQNSANAMLEVIDITSASQIRVGNSTSDNGGYISSGASNGLIFGGGVSRNGGTQIAKETSGSTIILGSGNTTFGYFTGATIGNTVSPSVSIFISNSGKINTGSTGSTIYRTTNGGSDIPGYLLVDPVSSLTSGIAMIFDTGLFGFTQGNGTRRILGASIVPSGLTSTAGSEVMGLDFKTQSGGTAATTKLTLTGPGALTLANGNFTLGTAGNKLVITEGSNGSVGQTTLVSGTKAITISGLTTASRAFVSLVTQGGTSTTTWDFIGVCTSNTLTITAITTTGATNTTDTSVVNYWIVN